MMSTATLAATIAARTANGLRTDGDRRRRPVKTLVRTYLDPDGVPIRVITEWWRRGTAPKGRECDRDPDMPGCVVTQFVRRVSGNEAFNPMVRVKTPSASSSRPASPRPSPSAC